MKIANPASIILVTCLISTTLLSEERLEVDLIVDGDYIVTMVENEPIRTSGSVVVDEGAIVAVGSTADIDASYTAKQRLIGTNRIVLPGLINGHTHAAMSLLRGIADDLELMTWLNDFIFPAEVKYVDEKFVVTGTKLACWEMIRGGTTAFVDMYYFPDDIAQVVEECGLRGLISSAVIDQVSPDATDAKSSLENGRAFMTKWKGRSSRITPLFGAHAVYTVSAEQLRATRDLAMELGVGSTTHVSESPFEVEYAKATYDTTSIKLLDSLGFFDVPTIAAHVVYPSDEDISILVEKSVGVIYNPTSNMKISSGIAPVVKMLEAGVAVGIGTDGPASNNDLDMWEEMRLATFLQKVSSMDPTVLDAETVLSLATRMGAKAIGLDSQVGTLEIGKRADLIQVDFSDVHHIPLYNVHSHLVYVTDEQDVVTTIVDGAILMKDRKILTLNTDEVAEEARSIAKVIAKDLVGQD